MSDALREVEGLIERLREDTCTEDDEGVPFYDASLADDIIRESFKAALRSGDGPSECDCGRHVDGEGNQIHFPPCPYAKRPPTPTVTEREVVEKIRQAAHYWRDWCETRTLENIPDTGERRLAEAVDADRYPLPKEGK